MLRHFRILDGEAMAAYSVIPRSCTTATGSRRSNGCASGCGTGLTSNYQKWGFGIWAVSEKSTREVIRYCGLSRFQDRCGQHEAEMGYRLARPHRGRGVGTEAARAARDYAFGTLSLPRLIAVIDRGNLASIRVAEKTGLRYEKDVKDVMFE